VIEQTVDTRANVRQHFVSAFLRDASVFDGGRGTLGQRREHLRFHILNTPAVFGDDLGQRFAVG
jgi:hypothetical protein